MLFGGEKKPDYDPFGAHCVPEGTSIILSSWFVVVPLP